MTADHVGLDTFAVATHATAADLNDLPRHEIDPLIHLVDIERAEHAERRVRTHIVIAGVGETFLVPRAWEVKCGKPECVSTPKPIDLRGSKELLVFCRMGDDQKVGFMRRLAGACDHRPTPRITAYATVTEFLAAPAVTGNVNDTQKRDHRDKAVAYLGPLPASQGRWCAYGEVIAARQQRASMFVTRLEPLQSAVEHFTITPDTAGRFRVLQVPPLPADVAEDAAIAEACRHAQRLAHDITRHLTRIYGEHRETILTAILVTFHSPIEIPWDGQAIKGVVDGMVIGDTGQGKTTMARRLMEAIGLGHCTSGSTANRVGLLYSLDGKVNDKRVLQWGAFPLAHGELLMLDEAQGIKREEWAEFTTARSEGILLVNRSIRAEHPSRVRLLCFANPLARHSMAGFQYGIQAVQPGLDGFLDDRDLRRFDWVACVSESDQPVEAIHQPPEDRLEPQAVTPDVLRDSVLWAWTRRPTDLRYTEGAEPAIKDMAIQLSKIFGTPEVPLLITDSHEKVARLAFGFAALLHSTDDTHQAVIVSPVHVALAGWLLTSIYMHPNAALDALAEVLRGRARLAEGEYEVIHQELLTPGSNRENTIATEAMLDLFLTEEAVTRADLDAATGLGREAMLKRLQILRKRKLIVNGRHGAFRKTPRFIAFLKQWTAGAANPSKQPSRDDRGSLS